MPTPAIESLAEGDEHFEVEDALWLLAEFPVAYATIPDLLKDCQAREITITRAALAKVLAQGRDDGLIEPWTLEDQLYFVLTPLAAERLGIVLEYARLPPKEADALGYLRDDALHVWLTRAIPRRSGRNAGRPRGPKHRQDVDLDRYLDPAQPEPLDTMIADEMIGSLVGPDSYKLKDGSRVFVRKILGLGEQWPAGLVPVREELVDDDGEPYVVDHCRGCRDRDLDRAAYCAVCDRLGVDPLLPPIEAILVQDHARAVERTGPLVGGQGEAPAPTPAPALAKGAGKPKKGKKKTSAA